MKTGHPTERLTLRNLADILSKGHGSIDDRSLRTVQRYLRGRVRFDILDAYTQDLIDAVHTYIERDPDLSALYND